MLGFQSTPPCGGDQVHDFQALVGGQFQSTPPCGGDVNDTFILIKLSISIHAPLRGRQPYRNLNRSRSRFQSTPPCGGDESYALEQALQGISIHAPLRGRRDSIAPIAQLAYISIHAPLRGRRRGGGPDGQGPDFNPRPLAGATSPG